MYNTFYTSFNKCFTAEAVLASSCAFAASARPEAHISCPGRGAALHGCCGRPRATSEALYSVHSFQLVDHAADDRQSAVPEFRIFRIQSERLEQLGIMLGAAGGEHPEVALGEAGLGVFVDRIERVHQAIAERVVVDIERRMD